MRLILASTSPRRREILGLLGIPFEVIPPRFDETISSRTAIEEEVLEFAVGKARSVALARPGSIIIGSDTMIAIDEAKLGKPTDRADAGRMLRRLSGKTHVIFTSVAILDDCGGVGLSLVAKVDVVMLPFSETEIESYLAGDESMDKAGAYSIQGEGRKLIAAIQGDYLAAVGLPLRPIARYLAGRGIKFSIDVEQLYATKAFLNWADFS